MMVAMSFCKEYYNRLQDVQKGYMELGSQIVTCEDQLNDYLVAKKMERENLIEDMKRRESEQAEMQKQLKEQEEMARH